MIEGNTKRVLIAGGGTGGHLFPGVSIAGKFIEKDPQTGILFVNTGRPLDKSILASAGYRLETVTAGGIKGVGILKKIRSLFSTASGVLDAARIIREFKPHLVMGMGSYSAAPVVVAARLLGIPTVLCEQNTLPGIANRLLSGFVKRIFISFDETRRFFKPEKTVLTGNPVRETLLGKAPEKRGENTPFTILVLGGSQGARSVNTAVTEALPFLSARPYEFIHQTGKGDEERIRGAYAKERASADVRGFIDDMAAVYNRADLVVARSGATTVAELTALGKPALFIPFPHAADNHQELNVKHLVEAGACIMIREAELTGKLLADRIEDLAASPERLSAMAEKAAKQGCPDAADTIVGLCMELIGEKRPPAEGKTADA